MTADSVGYLSRDGLYAAVGGDRKGFCDACFSGEYLLEFPHRAAATPPLRVVGS